LLWVGYSVAMDTGGLLWIGYRVAMGRV
jgi:hypothetical protein